MQKYLIAFFCSPKRGHGLTLVIGWITRRTVDIPAWITVPEELGIWLTGEKAYRLAGCLFSCRMTETLWDVRNL